VVSATDPHGHIIGFLDRPLPTELFVVFITARDESIPSLSTAGGMQNWKKKNYFVIYSVRQANFLF
jgi:hypothetical protein